MTPPIRIRIYVYKCLVEEEAAKFHILLDLTHCPQEPVGRLLRQPGYLNRRLAKGLQAKRYKFNSSPDAGTNPA